MPPLLSPQIIRVPGPGAEDVVVDREGWVWTGTEDGNIFRVSPDGAVIERMGNTEGRPLGLEIYGDRILVADAHVGLVVLDPSDGTFESLVVEVDNTPMVFCNNAAVAANGDIWFSDSSTEFPIENWKADFVQRTCTGRLLCRRADGSVEVVLEGLEFANGVALAPDDSWVAVAETGARTVVRVWLTGDRAGQRELMCSDLPGYPDNIAIGSDGLLWITIASPLDPVVEVLKGKAPLAVRRLVTKLPEAVQPKPKRTARVQAYAADGRLVHDLDIDATGFHMVTGVREHEGTVWLGSLVEPAIACVEVPTLP